MRVNLLRRVTQILVLALFILGNLGVVSILKGDLSSSVLFGAIPLSDPFAVLQIYLATGGVFITGVYGALIIFAFYALIAPRAFCGWVCPVNLLTDFAYFIRKKFGYKNSVLKLPKNLRYYILVLSLFLSFLLSSPVFEHISFVGLVQRGVIFLNSAVLGVIFVIIVFDAFISRRGICSHICPLGAFYAVSSKFSFIRVKHTSKNCTKCMKCRVVCPETHLLEMIAKEDFFVGSECISCGKCVEACQDAALKFSILRRK